MKANEKRQAAFKYFDNNMYYKELPKLLGIGHTTAYTYYKQWEKETGKSITPPSHSHKNKPTDLRFENYLNNLKKGLSPNQVMVTMKMGDSTAQRYLRQFKELYNLSDVRISNNKPVLEYINNNSKQQDQSSHDLAKQIEISIKENNSTETITFTSSDDVPQPQYAKETKPLNNKVETFRRGDIIMNMDTSRTKTMQSSSDSSLQSTQRPAIVIQNNKGNQFSDNLIIVPLTTVIKRTDLPTHFIIHSQALREPSMVLAEQIQTIDKSLAKKIGYLNYKDIEKLDAALQSSIFNETLTTKIEVKEVVKEIEKEVVKIEYVSSPVAQLKKLTTVFHGEYTTYCIKDGILSIKKDDMLLELTKPQLLTILEELDELKDIFV